MQKHTQCRKANHWGITCRVYPWYPSSGQHQHRLFQLPFSHFERSGVLAATEESQETSLAHTIN